jgi:acyl-coenzyme A synthetase/AMP-(fatty) acid ligase
VNFSAPLFELARQAPQAGAVVCAGGTLTRAELARAVDATASRFAREGLAQGDRVAIMLPTQIQLLVTSLALARIGVAQLCLQASDPPALASGVARRAKLAALIAPGKAANIGLARIEPPPADLRGLRTLPSAEPPSGPGGAEVYALVATSGTTADIPKLVVITHAQALWRVYQQAEAEDPASARLLSMTSLAFVGGMRSSLCALYGGGAIALPDGIGSVAQLVEFVARNRITTVMGSPVHAAMLLEEARAGTPLLPGLHSFRMSSTVVPDALRASIRERISPHLHILYGTSEAGPVTVASPDMVRRVPGVVGRAVPGVELRLVDDDGREVAAGARGQVWIRSPGMASGYLDDPGETSRRFRGGWFLPGDVAQLSPQGELVHHGRGDDVMIFEGLNVQPAEIESALLRHPAVAEAAAFPVRSAAHGDIPHAAVVLKGKADEAELLRFLRRELGVRAPKRVLLATELPRNPAGKLRRGELARLASRPPESPAGATPRTPSPPRHSTD